MSRQLAAGWLIVLGIAVVPAGPATAQKTLPGTEAWDDRGDHDTEAARMVAGLHRFLDRELAASVGRRAERWEFDTSSKEAYERSVAGNRERLGAVLGLVEPRTEEVAMHLVATTDAPARVAEAEGFRVLAVRWDVFDDVQAEGLLLEPKGEVRASLVAMPHCDVTPEAFVGLAEGLEPEAQVARLLAEEGCRVLVPTLIDRDSAFSGNLAVRMTNMPHREWVWRMAFELGRHLIGYEVETVRAAVDWFEQAEQGGPDLPVGVVGYGEGGRIALYAAALDPRIDAAWIAGAFAPREDVWKEPIDRDVWGLLEEFGDAEVATLIIPRGLLIEACAGPAWDGAPAPATGPAAAASGRLVADLRDVTVREYERLGELTAGPLVPGASVRVLFPYRGGREPTFNRHDKPRQVFLSSVLLAGPHESASDRDVSPPSWRQIGELPDTRARMGRVVGGWVDHTQALLRTSELRRDARWPDPRKVSLDRWEEETAPWRERFWEDLIGKFPPASEALRTRTIRLYDTPAYAGYAVELPVWPDVVASGVLLLPKDLKPGERRPVVVCQHGLEGTPEPIVDPEIKSPYNGFGAALAERGYIVYAPQNPYKGHDTFRQLQRKAHPLQGSIFAAIVRQHERTLQWLKTLPNVDPERIAFYGLSYGGKTAMRVPAILEDYCLSICSADFNEWAVKCTDLNRSTSYMFNHEYDMYEFALAEGFNYAEMAALIAPRPFFVERGHSDGVAPDEWIGHEFARVRRLYDRLGIGERCGIGYFNGGHQIEGDATFRFLAEHLRWPRGAEPLKPSE